MVRIKNLDVLLHDDDEMLNIFANEKNTVCFVADKNEDVGVANERDDVKIVKTTEVEDELNENKTQHDGYAGVKFNIIRVFEEETSNDTVTAKNDGVLEKTLKQTSCEESKKPRKLYPCNGCNKSFTSAARLNGHICGDQSEVNFSCSICGLTFKHRGSRSRHVKEQHLGVTRKKKSPINNCQSVKGTATIKTALKNKKNNKNCENVERNNEKCLGQIKPTVCSVEGDTTMLEFEYFDRKQNCFGMKDEILENQNVDVTFYKDRRHDFLDEKQLNERKPHDKDIGKINEGLKSPSSKTPIDQTNFFWNKQKYKDPVDCEIEQEKQDKGTCEETLENFNGLSSIIKEDDGITLFKQSKSQFLSKNKKVSQYQCNKCEAVFTMLHDFLIHQRIHK